MKKENDMVLNWKSKILMVGLSMFAIKGMNAQTLTTGCWTMNSNGNASQLCIDQINASGVFTGRLVFASVQKVHGLWDESSKRITFYLDTATLNEPAYFIGCYFPDRANNPTGLKRLTGIWVGLKSQGGTSSRFEFGWTATRF